MIIPVILEKEFNEIVKKVNIAEKFAEWIQIDIADNTLFRGETFKDINTIATIDTKAKLEIHLMVKNPMDYLEYKLKNVTRICSQVEALDNDMEFVEKSRELGYETGLSIGPDTNFDQLEDYIDKVDYIQFVDVIPGKQGGKQIKEVLFKIQNFIKKYPRITYQIDGGIKKSNILDVHRLGIKNIVVGSEIFRSSNPKEMYVKLTEMTKDKVASINKKDAIKVAILGGAAWNKEDQPYKEAYEVSKALAEAGYEVVNGGGPGVMRASTKGAQAGGGRVLAVTYHPNKPKRHYEGVDKENTFDDEVITLDYFDRTKVMLQTTQVHIVFKGSLGTLSEFGMSWISSWIHEPNNKPIILYGDFWEEYLDLIDKYMLVTDAERNIVKICSSPEEVLEFLRKEFNR